MSWEIDPKTVRPRKGRIRLSGPALHGVLLEVKPLSVLGDWEPVGARLEALIRAAQGLDGITQADVSRLRAWAQIWARLHPTVRDFYQKHVPDLDERKDCARIALWAIFRQRRRASGLLYRDVYVLWEEDHGCRPEGLEVIPTRIIS